MNYHIFRNCNKEFPVWISDIFNPNDAIKMIKAMGAIYTLS